MSELSVKLIRSFDLAPTAFCMQSNGDVRRFFYRGKLIRAIEGIPTVEQCNEIDAKVRELMKEESDALAT